MCRDFIFIVVTPFPAFPHGGRGGKLFVLWNPITNNSFRDGRGRENHTRPFPLGGNGKGGTFKHMGEAAGRNAFLSCGIPIATGRGRE